MIQDSAVLAVPANDDDFIYISSGTWSLMGIERKTPDCSLRSCELNFTNEGGYEGRFRYIKNIMGLWMIQSVRHEVNDAYSFAEICAMAEEAKDFPSRVDANDECFLSPENMTEEVKDYCRRTGQKVPETLGEIATVIYTSLADCYAKQQKELEELTGRTYSRIHVVGGGSNAGYLNELTAKATGKGSSCRSWRSNCDRKYHCTDDQRKANLNLLKRLVPQFMSPLVLRFSKPERSSFFQTIILLLSYMHLE